MSDLEVGDLVYYIFDYPTRNKKTKRYAVVAQIKTRPNGIVEIWGNWFDNVKQARKIAGQPNHGSWGYNLPSQTKIKHYTKEKITNWRGEFK